MPETKTDLSPRLVELAKRRGRVPALITATIVVGYLVLASLVGSFLTFVQYGAEAAAYGPGPFAAGALGELAFHVLPLGLGVFLGLWAIAPISHELELPYVLTRGGLAAGAGIVIELVVRVVRDFVFSFAGDGSLFGSAFPFPSFDGGYFMSALVGALLGAITGFIAFAPVVLLAVVLLWLWLKAHPREYSVAGLIDDI